MKSKPNKKDAGQKRLIKLKEIKVESLESNQCRVTVHLTCKGKNVIGERTGPDETDYKVMLAALSTLDALQKATGGEMKMDLLFIERQQVEKVGREIIMVLIDVTVDDDTRAATGACQVKGDVINTSARAVLDATNRMVELFFEN